MIPQAEKLIEHEPALSTSPTVGDGVTLEMIRANPRVQTFIRKSDEALAMVGYTEHGERHVSLVAKNARRILHELGYNNREAELAAIAGYLHDIGNAVNRVMHAQTGACIALSI